MGTTLRNCVDKFSPAPWYVYNDHLELNPEYCSGPPVVCGYGPDKDPEACSFDIAEVMVNNDEWVENARLIAAAPQLYAACVDVLNELECNCGDKCEGTCTYSIVKKAIEKADGKSQKRYTAQLIYEIEFLAYGADDAEVQLEEIEARNPIGGFLDNESPIIDYRLVGEEYDIKCLGEY